ncbi:MAG: hypothetical protein Q9162_005119 [Coniocarpon cinnabarinum]
MPFIQVGYKKIHYADWPPKDNQPPREIFVLIHGLGSSQNYYYPLIPHLTSHSIRCIALDTTGQGRSPYTGITQSVSSLASDILGAMDALSVSKAVLVGHSMAGLTVPQAATMAPERVSAIFLVGPVFPNPDVIPIFEERIRKVEESGMQPMADTVPFSATAASATSLTHGFIRELLLASQPAGYVSMCRVINSVNLDARNAPDYGKVTCPVFVVAGDEDKSAPLSGCEKLLGSVGGQETGLKVLERTGHWMCVERPEEVAREILGFWEAVK